MNTAASGRSDIPYTLPPPDQLPSLTGPTNVFGESMPWSSRMTRTLDRIADVLAPSVAEYHELTMDDDRASVSSFSSLTITPPQSHSRDDMRQLDEFKSAGQTLDQAERALTLRMWATACLLVMLVVALFAVIYYFAKMSR